MASEETFHAITKHVMGDRQGFDELKKRFESMEHWNSPAAAALGYLIAKDELAAEKKEEEEEPDIYDEAVEVMKKYGHPHSHISPHTATDEIFTLIYEWLDKSLAEKGMALEGLIRRDIRELFKPFVIEKSE
jgi:hypothetical protein